MIPVFKPHIGSETIKAATDALDMGWLGMGSLVKEFEESIASYLELEAPRQAVAVNTCTSALHLALLLAEVGPGDEVITPALNNIGDFQAIGMCGARPVFADIREDDLGLDPVSVEEMIGPKVRAIIALHYTGIPCHIREIREIARRRGIRLIEDAAHATGTRVFGRPIGAEGDLACFSFDAIKTLTCIDGGLVVTARPEEAARLYPLRLLGMTQPNERLYANSRAYQFDVCGQGFRYHLANLHAAIGLSQLKALPTFIANRRSYCALYRSMLDDVPGILTPSSDFADASMFVFVIRVLGGKRSELAAHLRSRGIDTGIHWVPGNRHQWLRGARGADKLPVTDRVGDEILTLPLWSFMTPSIIAEVASAIREFFGKPSTLARPAALKGQALLEAVKVSAGAPYRIPISGFRRVGLRAVSTGDPLPEDVKSLTEWRNRNVTSFLSEFVATEERTRNWLTQSVARDPSRILFMIEEEGKDPLGYVGLAFVDWALASGEADSVVRGRDDQPGIMAAAMRTLLEWGRQELGLAKYGVRVLSDNPANQFYVKFGFKENRRDGLRREESPGFVLWRGVPPGAANDGRWLIHYELTT
jgi:dTDP-4-amino-4,6-dideoxygalactose transaminase/RimJ/RimL family protein N-acetyltransferase